MDMEAPDFNRYLMAIPVLQSREQLISLTASDWPNIKKNKRREIFSSIKKQAYPNIKRTKLELTEDSLRELING